MAESTKKLFDVNKEKHRSSEDTRNNNTGDNNKGDRFPAIFGARDSSGVYASEGAKLHLRVLFRGQGTGAGREGRWIAALRAVI